MHERAMLLFALGRSAAGTALEVGCDGGRWSTLMREHDWELMCTDIDAGALAVCKRRLPDARCFLVAPEDEALPQADNEADLILVYAVGSVVSSNWFVPEASRVLAPGGLLVYS